MKLPSCNISALITALLAVMTIAVTASPESHAGEQPVEILLSLLHLKP
ncbi:MAG: hypothetical protein IGS50_06360 [Synechococcales cyanobacterium C42_A2020_086]|jgi:hypothetical protein|nr:hypothetical protein [Synechococcales cyanobacterium M58_A2018_015]MBF2073371.1 hypothetical protein [Synechococcales cyanobacterium C42_A2020_086]